MERAPAGRGLRAALTVAALATASLLATGTAASAASCATGHSAPRHGHIAGIVSAVNVHTHCQVMNGELVTPGSRAAGDTANGTPPLIYHGGAVMGTATTGPLVITPIFWDPAGHPMTAAYKKVLTTLVSDVAAASGRNNNVFSTATEYSGTDGVIQYNVQAGTPINDTGPLPASGCKLLPADHSGIYADNTGYDSCLDDAQVQAEIDRVIDSQHLPRNLSHIYVLYLPKHVESCFDAGETSSAKNQCTINHEPSAAFCAYHGPATSGAIYANMPFPVYGSSTGFTCGSDAVFPNTIETPNGNPDADTETSPTSHEVMESWTDPDTATGWFDSSGFENGDECAFIFGPTSGTSGQLFNQTINRDHYLIQEEFSNKSFFASGGGCLQGENAA